MITAIIYESKAGHTKRYAEMLSDKINAKAMSLKEAKKELKGNDEIVFLGWVCATKIKGLRKAKRHNIKCVGAVGIYPKENTYTDSLAKSNDVDEKLFYLRGGIDFDKLSKLTKKFFNWIAKMMKIDNKPENKELIELFEYGKDFVDEANLDEMVEYLAK